MEPRAVALRRYDSALAGVVEEALREKGGSAQGRWRECGSVQRRALSRRAHAGGSLLRESALRGLLCRGARWQVVSVRRCGVRSSDRRVEQQRGDDAFWCADFSRSLPTHVLSRISEGKLALCMPKSDSYFRSLERLPLEEALLHHLESARGRLCAMATHRGIRSIIRSTCSAGRR